MNENIACKMLASISSTFYPGVFCTKNWGQNSKPKSKYKKAAQRLFYTKFMGKMMMKLTLGEMESLVK